jgi:septal ring factor EnvC (AmiA/AmiB activator)
MIPGSSGLPIAIQVGIWVLLIVIGCLSGICVFLVKNFLGSIDLKFSEVFKKFSSQAESIDDVVAHTHEQLSTVKDEVRDDLNSIKQETKEMRNTVHDARVDIRGFSKDIEVIKKDIEKCHNFTEAQQRNISNMAKAIGVHHQQIKTIIERIGPDTVMVKTKKD